MKRTLWISLAGVAAFLAILLARAPAEWLLPSGPRAPFHCTSLEGSLWSGGCSGLTVQGASLGDLAWSFAPGELLHARLGAHVTLASSAGRASADAALSAGGLLSARNVEADLTLDPRLLRGLPRELHGSAHAQLALLAFKDGALTDLKGTIEAHNLEDRAGHVTPLGSYAVSFPGGTAEPTGAIHDLGGPLSLKGTLRLTRQGGYELDAKVAPRPQASPELTNNLNMLGSPDAAGERQLTLSGSF